GIRNSIASLAADASSRTHPAQGAAWAELYPNLATAWAAPAQLGEATARALRAKEASDEVHPHRSTAAERGGRESAHPSEDSGALRGRARRCGGFGGRLCGQRSVGLRARGRDERRLRERRGSVRHVSGLPAAIRRLERLCVQRRLTINLLHHRPRPR